MNIMSGGMTAMYLIEHGGVTPGDALVLLQLYRRFSAGHFQFSSLTDGEISALVHVYGELTKVLADVSQKEELVAFIKSWPTA